MARLTDYYSTLRERYGYDCPDFALGELSASEMRRRFVVADGLGTVDPDEVLVSTGVSVTGPPHVGTLGQLLTTLALRDAGFDVRAVFADLVVYHAHGIAIEDARALAERYRAFARSLGFATDELHTQSTSHDVLYTGQLLARYHEFEENETDADPPAFERELADAYDRAGESPLAADTRASTVFGHQQASHLLVADQLHPLISGTHGTVVFVGGADNHRLAAGVREVLRRSPYSGTLAGLYTPLVAGYDGFPKLSKSIPPSRFTLDAPPERIRERIVTPDNVYDYPTESLVFQMFRLASPYSADELASIRGACAAGGEEWTRVKDEYAEWLVDVAARWKATR